MLDSKTQTSAPYHLPDIQEFLEQELASGEIQALKVYRELKTRHEAFCADVEAAISAAERGEVAPFDIGAIKSELVDEAASASLSGRG